MEPEKPVLQGILLFPPQGVLGQLKKTWHKRFCQLFKASKHGIERLEVYDSEDEAMSLQHSPRIVTLEACVKISPSNQQHVFTVVTKTGHHHFGCFAESEMTTWIVAFQSVAFKDSQSSETLEEDNDLYCTFSGEEVFAVKLVASDASARCGLEPRNYTLIIAAADIKLMDGDAMVFTWPYQYIRRYGYRDGKFTFEAGRKCDSGEGSFHMEYTNQQEIFRCISSKMKCMKKLLNGKTSPSIECNDAQLHAALSMEAGSRSPLPPSPNSSTNLVDIDFSTISQNSQKLSNPSSSNLDSISFIRPPPPIIKPKPAKPPRKHILTAVLEKNRFNPEFPDLVSCGKYHKLTPTGTPELPANGYDWEMIKTDREPYDFVEVRNDAWKTLGVDTIPHTEKVQPFAVAEDEDDYYESQYETMEKFQKLSNNPTKGTLNTGDIVATSASPIIHNNVPNRSEPPAYDKLQHFGSTPKLNHNPGYKTPNSQINAQINPNPPATPTYDTHPSWSDYELVDDMCAVRLADDSHHGYGIIRKKCSQPDSAPDTDASAGPQHSLHNESEYAIVSKPKRV